MRFFVNKKPKHSQIFLWTQEAGISSGMHLRRSRKKTPCYSIQFLWERGDEDIIDYVKKFQTTE